MRIHDLLLRLSKSGLPVNRIGIVVKRSGFDQGWTTAIPVVAVSDSNVTILTYGRQVDLSDSFNRYSVVEISMRGLKDRLVNSGRHSVIIGIDPYFGERS